MKTEISYTPTKVDYMECVRQFMKKPKMSILISSTMIIYEIIFFKLAFDGMEKSMRISIGTIILVFIIPLSGTLAILFLSTLSGRQTVKQVKKNPQLLSFYTWRFDELQISSKNEVSESKLKWDVFKQVMESEHYYLLINKTNNRIYNFIPKRAFNSPEQEEGFRSLVEQKLGKIQSNYKVNIVLYHLINWIGIAILWAIPLLFSFLFYLSCL